MCIQLFFSSLSQTLIKHTLILHMISTMIQRQNFNIYSQVPYPFKSQHIFLYHCSAPKDPPIFGWAINDQKGCRSNVSLMLPYLIVEFYVLIIEALTWTVFWLPETIGCADILSCCQLCETHKWYTTKLKCLYFKYYFLKEGFLKRFYYRSRSWRCRR